MIFFKECKTKEEVKAEFKRLAKIHHPDRGGKVETMQVLNAEYSQAIKRVLTCSNFTAEEIESEILNAENYKKAIQAIVNLEGLIIELCGSWLWVSGETFKYKGVFKESGFFWASNKKMWYFRGAEHKSPNSKKISIEEVRRLHGSQVINKANFKTNYIN